MAYCNPKIKTTIEQEFTEQELWVRNVQIKRPETLTEYLAAKKTIEKLDHLLFLYNIHNKKKYFYTKKRLIKQLATIALIKRKDLASYFIPKVVRAKVNRAKRGRPSITEEKHFQDLCSNTEITQPEIHNLNGCVRGSTYEGPPCSDHPNNKTCLTYCSNDICVEKLRRYNTSYVDKKYNQRKTLLNIDKVVKDDSYIYCGPPCSHHPTNKQCKRYVKTDGCAQYLHEYYLSTSSIQLEKQRIKRQRKKNKWQPATSI